MKNFGLCFLASFLLLTVAFPNAANCDEEKGWTMVFGNAQGNCASESSGPSNQNLELKWAFQSASVDEISDKQYKLLNPFVLNDICITQDGKGVIYCLDIDEGSIRWQSSYGGILQCIYDNKMLITKRDSINRNKEERATELICVNLNVDKGYFWSNKLSDGYVVCTKIIHHKNSIYFAAASPLAKNQLRVYSLDKSNGGINWQHDLKMLDDPNDPKCLILGPAIADSENDGKLALAMSSSASGKETSLVVGFDLDTGVQSWKVDLSEETINSMSCEIDKVLCLTSKKILCIRPSDGKKY